SIGSIVKHDAVTVDADDILMDLFVPAVESKLAVAVTDANDRLVGVIPRVTLLAALGPGPGSTEEITLPSQPVPSTVIDQVLADSEDGRPVEAPSARSEEVR